MSAYMCSERQLTILAAYLVAHCTEVLPSSLWVHDIDRDGYEREHGGHERAVNNVFRMLARENLASLDSRYPGDAKGDADAYRPVATARKERLPWLHIIKLCHHYAYQACEHSGWKDSAARKAIAALESYAVHNLPGYDDAPWGLS